ncbi:hypothetical protein AWENTII_002089 [Aspergillus wentii]
MAFARNKSTKALIGDRISRWSRAESGSRGRLGRPFGGPAWQLGRLHLAGTIVHRFVGHAVFLVLLLNSYYRTFIVDQDQDNPGHSAKDFTLSRSTPPVSRKNGNRNVIDRR